MHWTSNKIDDEERQASYRGRINRGISYGQDPCCCLRNQHPFRAVWGVVRSTITEPRGTRSLDEKESAAAIGRYSDTSAKLGDSDRQISERDRDKETYRGSNKEMK